MATPLSPPSALSPRSQTHQHIPRPPNCFILFRTYRIRNIGATERQANFSKMLAEEWRNLSQAERDVWKERAEAKSRLHKEMYPDYKYRPVRRTSKPRRTNAKKTKKPYDHNDRSFGSGIRAPGLTYSTPPHPGLTLPHNGQPSLQYPTWSWSPADRSLAWPFPSFFPEFTGPDETTGGALQTF